MDTAKYTSEILKRRDEERQVCKRLAIQLEQSDVNLMQILTSFQNHAVGLCRGAFSSYSRVHAISLTETKSRTAFSEILKTYF